MIAAWSNGSLSSLSSTLIEHPFLSFIFLLWVLEKSSGAIEADDGGAAEHANFSAHCIIGFAGGDGIVIYSHREVEWQGFW